MGTLDILTGIDLHDIQGLILKGYGPYGFPVARYVFYQIQDEAAGRAFVDLLRPLVTTSAPWTHYGDVKTGTKTPPMTTNIAFTFAGLRSLGVPEKTLLSFPEEFATGMTARVPILGDDGVSAPEHWDPIWHSKTRAQETHIFVSINANDAKFLSARYDEITAMLLQVQTRFGVDSLIQLPGHRDATSDTAIYQDAEAVKNSKGDHTPKEHFGYTDGISEPYVENSGSYETYVIGGGKRVKNSDPATIEGWKPLRAGEFLLGHVDEAGEYPAAPIPGGLSKNGSFLVYRKLHQNVKAFNDYADTQGELFGDPMMFRAKLVGRWPNGAPLITHPTQAAADSFIAELYTASVARKDTTRSAEDRAAAKARYYALKSQLTGYDYDGDIEGARCPVGAHNRRVNSRSGLEFGVKGAFNTPDALVNRRRILRRGLPYGQVTDPTNDNGNHGIIFMAVGASIARQFEFVQQQWVNYGNDFRLASDRDPLIGNHPEGGGRMVIEGDPTTNKPPFFCTAMPRFVETRGGDYYFVPSLTALTLLANGTVDPT